MIVDPPKPSATRVSVPPLLAMRAAVLGVVALVAFGAIFFRLWYLQILSGSKYLAEAHANAIREVPIPAPRGEILDAEGKPLVADKVVDAVQIDPTKLPESKSERSVLYRALGRVLGLSVAHIEALIERGHKEVPYAPVTIDTEAGRQALTVLSEHANELPGVQQQPLWIPSYPYGEMAAQVLGYVGQVSQQELRKKAFQGVPSGTIVGQSGLEYAFEPYLRGQDGSQRIEVNAAEEPVPVNLPPVAPVRGENLRTSLDMNLQRAGEKALREAIARQRASGKPATAGAFVAMDPLTGEVLAMGSYPSFNPEAFNHPLTKSEYDALLGPRAPGEPSPTVNYATEGLFPTGSSFKPVTAMAAMEGGYVNPLEHFGPGPCLEFGGLKFCNAGDAPFPPMDMSEALTVSSDTYFFTVGKRAFEHEGTLQAMAHKLGVGEETGIELDESQGVVPDASWRAEMNRLQEKCEREYPREPKSKCGYVSEVKPWTFGEEMDLAVGQGSLQTNPLQMAVAYSTLVDAWRNDGNGWRVRPHFGLAITNASGRLVRKLSAPPVARVHLNPEYLGYVFEGIHGATTLPGGTSTAVWTGWNEAAHPTYGKTGTAEVFGQEEDSWYACYVADSKRPIVITAMVEHGGFGEEAAAPISRAIATEWFYGRSSKIVQPSEIAL
jgi:penicillin-binding protein 2